MAYAGTTSTAANTPFMVSQGISGVAPAVWMYNSTHSATEITVANFFTDGQDLGMNVGDHLIAVSTAYQLVSYSVTAVGATTTAVSTGLVIST